MSKKRLFAFVFLGVFALYIICGVITFSSTKKYVDQAYFSAASDFTAEINETEFSAMTQYEDTTAEDAEDTLISNCRGIGCSSGYPFALSVIKGGSEVVCKSESFINFTNDLTGDEYYVPIDNYLTPEIKNEIYNFQKKYYDNRIGIFEYNIKNEEIVPVSMTLVSVNDKSAQLKINFSLGKAEEHVKAPIGEYSTNGEYSSMLDVTFYNLKQKGLYHGIYNALGERASLDNISAIASMSEEDRANHDDSFEEYIDNFQIGDQMYTIYAVMAHDTNYDALKSDVFKNGIINQTVLFAIAGAVIFIASGKMYDKTKRLNDSKQAFTAAAAHELKTPLAIIQNQCECVMENVNPEKNASYVNSIYDESLRMSSLVSELLEYNRLVSADKVQKDKAFLADIINAELEKYKPLMDKSGLGVRKSICDRGEIVCHAELIALVIDNFISNAVKHTAAGEKISIDLSKTSSGYRLSVFNPGKGISKEYQNNLWDVFYRDDKARNSGDNSCGMGLALCKQILRLHGYKYGFENREGGVEFYFITQ